MLQQAIVTFSKNKSKKLFNFEVESAFESRIVY